MPVYVYECPQCGVEEEIFTPYPISSRYDDDIRPVCEICGLDMQRIPAKTINEFGPGFFDTGGY